MPHDWNGIIAVTEDELVPKHYPSYESLKKAIQRHADKPFGPKRLRKGGGGHELLVSFDSLHKDIQQAIGDPRRPGHIMELYYQWDAEAVRFYADYTLEDGSYLKSKHQEEYVVNASVLRACAGLMRARENERRSKGGNMKGLMKSVCADAASFNVTLLARHGVSHTLPRSVDKFKKALKAFANPTGWDYTALISGKLGNSNARVVTDELVKFLNDLFAGHDRKPSRTEVHRQYEAFLAGYIEVINPETAESYDPKALPKISDSTVINYLGEWENRIGTYAHRSGNSQTLRGKFLPHFAFQKPVYGGSLISVDDREPPFWYEKGKRPVLYLGVDGASGAWTFVVHGTEKKGIMLEAYRQMVRNYTEWGLCLPAEIECEVNGNSPFAGTFLRDGVLADKVRMIPNNARAKMVERFIGYMRYNEQGEKGRYGWMARPFAQSEANQAGPEQAKRDIILPYKQIIEGCLKDIEDWNNSEHPEHPGKSRWDYFIDTQHPALKPTNWKALLPHLGFVTQTSVKAGMVTLQGRKWLLGDNGQMHTGEALINVMKQCEGRDVTAYWLDRNDGGVLKAVIFLGDRCICELAAQPMPQRADIEKTDEDRRLYTEMAKYVSTVEAFMHRRQSSIEQVLVIDNRDFTVNRRFQIPGLNRFQPAEREEEPEVLDVPEGDDMELIPNQPGGFARTQIDRF